MATDCTECDKKQKRIEELERMIQNMADSYDAARNADAVDFVQGLEVVI